MASRSVLGNGMSLRSVMLSNIKNDKDDDATIPTQNGANDIIRSNSKVDTSRQVKTMR